jgi:hypothetical protein
MLFFLDPLITCLHEVDAKYPSNGMNETVHLDMPNSFDLKTGFSNWDEIFPLTNHSFTPTPNDSDHWSFNFGPPIPLHTFPQELLLQQPVLFPALNEKAMDVDNYEREGFNQSLNCNYAGNIIWATKTLQP